MAGNLNGRKPTPNNPNALDPVEVEVLQWVARGHTNPAVAALTRMAVSTVEKIPVVRTMFHSAINIGLAYVR